MLRIGTSTFSYRGHLLICSSPNSHNSVVEDIGAVRLVP
jgi:hypothetical protein